MVLLMALLYFGRVEEEPENDMHWKALICINFGFLGLVSIRDLFTFSPDFADKRWTNHG